MRLVLFFLGGFLLANIVVAGVTAIRPLASEQRPREFNLPREFNMSQKRQDPWKANETIHDQTRKTARANVLAMLGGANLKETWPEFCGEDGRMKLVAGLSYYYEQRDIQERGYPLSFGEAGARHIKKAWSTADDVRIERLTREIYSRGYFTPDDFRPHVKDAITERVSGEAVTGKACG
jgi:hypothetical protein